MPNFLEKGNKSDNFWSWFTQNSDHYYQLEKKQSQLFAELKSELNKIHQDLVFEFSSIRPDNKRELVISADGIKSVFPVVKELISKAPKLSKWDFIAFRQPRKVSNIKYEHLDIKIEDIFFKYKKDNGKIDLELHIKDFYESPEWTAAAFVLLDNIVGEYHTEMSISTIEKKTLNVGDSDNLLPIILLPQIIHSYQKEYSN